MIQSLPRRDDLNLYSIYNNFKGKWLTGANPFWIKQGTITSVKKVFFCFKEKHLNLLFY